MYPRVGVQGRAAVEGFAALVTLVGFFLWGGEKREARRFLGVGVLGGGRGAGCWGAGCWGAELSAGSSPWGLTALSPTSQKANEITPKAGAKPPRLGSAVVEGSGAAELPPKKSDGARFGVREGGNVHLGVDDLVPAQRARLPEALPANFANKGSGSRVHRHVAS